MVHLPLDELEKERPAKITVQLAAKIMDDRFSFGTAVKMKKRWAYYINTATFIKYMKGCL